MVDYWNITGVSLDLVGIAGFVNTITYDLGIPLLFVVTPAIIIILSVGKFEKLNSVLLAGLYAFISSMFFFSLGLIDEFYVVGSLVIVGLVAFVKMVKGGL